MKSLFKIILGVANVVPFITFAAFLIFIPMGQSTSNPVFIVLGTSTAILIPALMVFYIVHVYRNSSVARDQKHLWAALLLFGTAFVFPFYWYIHILRMSKSVSEIRDTGISGSPGNMVE